MMDARKLAPLMPGVGTRQHPVPHFVMSGEFRLVPPNAALAPRGYGDHHGEYGYHIR
jgi:hypothetical protein